MVKYNYQLYGTLMKIILSLTLLAIALCSNANEQKAKELFALAPNIRLDNKDIDNYHIKGRFIGQGLNLQFTVIGKGENNVSLYLIDGRDQTPIYAAKGGKGFLNDILEQRLLFSNFLSTFHFRIDEEANFVWGFK